MTQFVLYFYITFIQLSEIYFVSISKISVKECFIKNKGYLAHDTGGQKVETIWLAFNSQEAQWLTLGRSPNGGRKLGNGEKSGL